MFHLVPDLFFPSPSASTIPASSAQIGIYAILFRVFHSSSHRISSAIVQRVATSRSPTTSCLTSTDSKIDTARILIRLASRVQQLFRAIMPNTVEERRAWRKQYVAKKAAQGLCRNCLTRPHAEGHVCCTPCLLAKRINLQLGQVAKAGVTIFSDGLGICPICLRMKPLVLDHCHKTHSFRGWICQACNAALGLLADDPELFGRAIEYLQRPAGGALPLSLPQACTAFPG